MLFYCNWEGSFAIGRGFQVLVLQLGGDLKS